LFLFLAYAQTWGEIAASFVNAAVSFALVSVIWLTVAPLFGLRANGARRESDYNEYYGYQQAETEYQYENPYYGYDYQGRSLQDGLLSRAAQTLFNRYRSRRIS